MSIGVVVAAVLFVAYIAAVAWRYWLAPPWPPSMGTELELHATRRRLESAWLIHQARADASRLRRELDRELEQTPPTLDEFVWQYVVAREPGCEKKGEQP